MGLGMGLGVGTGNGTGNGTGSGTTNKQRLTEWDIGVEAVFSKEGRVAAPLVLGNREKHSATTMYTHRQADYSLFCLA